MFRYRCPHCRQLLQALEIRAGKVTVCSKCSKSLTIPKERTEWLNERGDPLLASPTVLIPAPPEVNVSEKADSDSLDIDADADVLGAIFVGAVTSSGPESANLNLDVMAPPEPVESPAPKSAVVARPVEPPKPAPPPEPVPVAKSKTPPPQPASTPRFVPPSPPPSFTRSLPHDVPTPAAAREPEPEPEPMPSRRTAAAVVTPPPRPAAPVVRAPAEPARPQPSRRLLPARRDDAESVSFNPSPLHLRTPMEVAADLTAALTSRMKPPPKPPRDLHPSTALWLITTGLAIALLILTLTTTNTFAQAVGAVGIGQMVAGYLWIVWMVLYRDWRRGLLCAVPPATFWFLTRQRFANYRPLRFVATGSVLLLLGGLANAAAAHTRNWVGANDGTSPAYTPAVDVATQPKLVQLRYYREQRAFDSLTDLLRTLARTDPFYSEDAKSRPEIAGELKSLCGHPDVKVKVEAMAAYALWGGADARGVCLAATRSTNPDERIAALRLLGRWKDPEVARAVADRVGRLSDTETSVAVETLAEIGQPAERAIFPLLRSKEQSTRLVALDVLARDGVGGADSVAELKALAGLPDEAGLAADARKVSDDPVTRQKAAVKAQVIQDRIKK